MDVYVYSLFDDVKDKHKSCIRQCSISGVSVALIYQHAWILSYPMEYSVESVVKM